MVDLERHDQQPRAQQQQRHHPPLQPLYRDHAPTRRRQRVGLQPGVDQPVAARDGRREWCPEHRLREDGAERAPRGASARQPHRHHAVQRERGRLLQPAESCGRARCDGLHRPHRASRHQLRKRSVVRPDRRDHGAHLLRGDRRERRPCRRAWRLPELRGITLVRGACAPRLDRSRRSRPRHGDQGQPHQPARLGCAPREGQARHAQRDADGDRPHRLHRVGRGHHPRPRSAVLADIQPRHLERQVSRGQPQPGERPAEAGHLGLDAGDDPAQPG